MDCANQLRSSRTEYDSATNPNICHSSRIEPIPPNIRNDIVSESGLSHRKSRLEKKNNETSQIPTNEKKSIRGDSGDSLPVWNWGITDAHLTADQGVVS